MRVSINNFTDFRMAKESSLQLFPIDLFVKKAYHVVKILYKYNGQLQLQWENKNLLI